MVHTYSLRGMIVARLLLIQMDTNITRHHRRRTEVVAIQRRRAATSSAD